MSRKTQGKEALIATFSLILISILTKYLASLLTVTSLHDPCNRLHDVRCYYYRHLSMTMRRAHSHNQDDDMSYPYHVFLTCINIRYDVYSNTQFAYSSLSSSELI